MKITVSSMTLSHLKEIEALEQKYFSTPWSYAGLFSELDNKNAVFLVATNQDNQVVGYIGSHLVLDVLSIANLVIDENFRNQGFASLLLNSLIVFAKQNNACEVTLEVRASNSSAISLYQKHGFESLGFRKNFYSYPTEDALIMTKYITKQ